MSNPVPLRRFDRAEPAVPTSLIDRDRSPSGTPPEASGRLRAWFERARQRWQALSGRVRGVVDSDRLWHEFADRIAQSYTLRGVEEALVRAVSEATGGCRVELLRESTPLAAASGPKLLASWSAESEGS